MLRRAMYLAVFFPVFVLALLGGELAVAQSPASDEGAYCVYLTEQAKAQSDLLRTPNAVGALTQPDTGLPTQLVGGLTLSLSSVKKAGITLDAAQATYYLGRENVLQADQSQMSAFTESLFAYLQRNAVSADRHFRIPPNQAIEIGIRLGV